MNTMTNTFSEILDEVDSFAVPNRMQKFLIREAPPSDTTQTLAFYAYAYERAFEEMVDHAKANWRGGGYLQFPVFFMARHSIELHLKWAIEEFYGYTGDPSGDHGHHLVRLWQELKRQFALAGMPDEEEWGKHCGRLLEHIHQIDPTGEAFRYPHNLGGVAFQYTRVELEGLAKAHHHITMYCGASLDMLEYGRG
jgi:hypothetical protein